MTNRGKKIITVLVSFVAVVAMFVGIAFWQTGMFSTPTLSLEDQPQRWYIYLPKSGPFSGIMKAEKELETFVQEQKIAVIRSCGVYFNDPELTPPEKLQWHIGYTVRDSINTILPLKTGKIPANRFLVARIKAHPFVAAQKCYPALKKWIKENSYQVCGPAVEFYNEDGLIEICMPVQQK